MERFTTNEARTLISPRSADSHKGTYGHGLLIAGSYGMAGAALMAARACLRSGIGLMTVSTPECNRIILQTAVPEAMVRTNGERCWTDGVDDISRYSAIAVGPGLGTNPDTGNVLARLLKSASDTGKQLIIDADALNIIASSDLLDLLEGTIITPHPGEFDRLLKCYGQSYDKSRRSEQASEFAAQYNCHVILKGHATVVASPYGNISVNTTGNPGMATGGSGDVLTGILLALAAQGLNAFDAARLGVFIHGLAGDMAADSLSQIAMTATDIISFLPEAWTDASRRCN